MKKTTREHLKEFLKTPEARRRWRERMAEDKKRRAAAAPKLENLAGGTKKKQIAVYLRVSTTGQDVRSQEPDLRAWLKGQPRRIPVTWYRDTFTGRTFDRPGMAKLENDIRARMVDTLLVWRLDRLGRTAGETITFLDRLHDAGVRFVSIRDGVDTSSASGRLLRTILAGFAEYEREVISERIRAGVERAKKEGKRWGGRKRGARYRLTPEKLKALRQLLEAGTKKAAIARQLGISEATVYRALKVLVQLSPSEENNGHSAHAHQRNYYSEVVYCGNRNSLGKRHDNIQGKKRKHHN